MREIWPSSLSRDALFNALRARPPRTLLAHADRMLLASVADPLDERASLLSRADGIVAHAHALEKEGSALFGELTTLLVLTALYLEHGAPAGDELRVFLAPFCLAARATVEARAEPERSVYLHWQQRANLGKPFTVGAAPRDDVVALYHWVHVVFYATSYGARPLPGTKGSDSERAHAALTNARAVLSRIDQPNADCVAEVLLANECMRPLVDVSLRDALRASLGGMQQADGTLDMPDEADPEARHHAMVVAALALALAGDD